MSRRTGLVALGLGVLIAAGATWLLVGRGADGSRWVRVDRSDLPIVVEAPGRLETAIHVEIGPPSVRDVWRYNLTWMIPEGSWVEPGDVVARFDATELEDRLRAERAALETTRQTKEKERRNLEVALRELQLDLVRAEGELKLVDLDLAVPEALVSSLEVRENRLRRDLARRRVEFLREKIAFEREWVRSSIELLEAKERFSASRIESYEAVRDRFDVRSPVGGLVVYVPKRGGERWEVGESVWMLAKILRVADVSTLQVEATVLEADSAAVAPGQTAEIAFDALPGTVVTSRVESIGNIVRERSLQDRSKVFDVALPLDGVDLGELRPGMGVQVRIETDRIREPLTVPVGAIRTDAAGTWVAVLRSGNELRQPVVLGPRGGDRVVVREGLEAGDRVRLPDPA